MKRLISASRAIVLATGMVLAATSFAAAEDAASEESSFQPTMYGGASLGFAEQHDSKFGWSVSVMARFFEHVGAQIEYMNYGSVNAGSGNYDGVYFGVAPILPVGHGVDLYAQLGIGIGDPGDDVVAGGGFLYKLPIELFEKNGVDLCLRTDYKYWNVDEGAHLLTFGFMFGFHK